MKVGVITFHFVNNFGGALQAYALQKFLEDKCQCESRIINYKNWFIRFTDCLRIFPITTKFDEMKTGLITVDLRKGRLQKFENFINCYCKLTKVYGSNHAIKSGKLNYDKYICGSDQIWNPILTGGVAKPYFLEFEEDAKKKIAYAPSMGTQEIPFFWLKKISRYVNNLGYISVREACGIKTIEQMTGRKVQQLIDPTFLLEEKEWAEISQCPVKLPEYILIYMMQKDDEVYEHALWMKKKWNLPIVDISRYGFKPDFVDVSLVDVGPREFVGLFQNAEYVCTNSYHGLVFSLIFRKKICLIPSKRFGSRISNLLQLLEIEYNVSSDDMESYMLNYNITDICTRINAERMKALQYLYSSLNEIG